MAKTKGSTKTGGRKAGTPNLRSLMLIDTLDSLGLDVPSRIAALLPSLDPEKQADVLLELISYIYPKRKALELTGAIELNNYSSLTPLERQTRIDELLSKQNAK